MPSRRLKAFLAQVTGRGLRSSLRPLNAALTQPHIIKRVRMLHVWSRATVDTFQGRWLELASEEPSRRLAKTPLGTFRQLPRRSSTPRLGSDAHGVVDDAGWSYILACPLNNEFVSTWCCLYLWALVFAQSARPEPSRRDSRGLQEALMPYPWRNLYWPVTLSHLRFKDCLIPLIVESVMRDSTHS